MQFAAAVAILCTSLPTFFDCDLHEGQARWMRNSVQKENCLATGNRWGKSVVTAVKHLHHCAYRLERDPSSSRLRPYKTFNVSITLDQGTLAFATAQQLAEAPAFKWMVEDVVMTPFPRMKFKNGAEFHVRSTKYKGKHIEGQGIAYISYDEVAYEPDESVIDEKILMRLADTDGWLDLIGTPRGRTWYYHRFLRHDKGIAGCYSQTGSSYENPHVSKTALQEYERTKPERLVQQNIYGRFVAPENAVFAWEDIQASYDVDLDYRIEKQGGVELIRVEKAKPGHKYVTGWDLAKEQDWTVGITLDVSYKPWRLVAYERFGRQPWPYVEERIKTRAREYPGTTIVDATGVGGPVVDHVRASGVRTIGFVFTGPRKEVLISNAQSCLEHRRLRMPFIRQLVDELEGYERNDAAIECDTVMSLALALWVAERRGGTVAARTGSPSGLERDRLFPEA